MASNNIATPNLKDKHSGNEYCGVDSTPPTPVTSASPSVHLVSNITDVSALQAKVSFLYDVILDRNKSIDNGREYLAKLRTELKRLRAILIDRDKEIVSLKETISFNDAIHSQEHIESLQRMLEDAQNKLEFGASIDALAEVPPSAPSASTFIDGVPISDDSSTKIVDNTESSIISSSKSAEVTRLSRDLDQAHITIEALEKELSTLRATFKDPEISCVSLGSIDVPAGKDSTDYLSTQVEKMSESIVDVETLQTVDSDVVEKLNSDIILLQENVNNLQRQLFDANKENHLLLEREKSARGRCLVLAARLLLLRGVKAENELLSEKYNRIINEMEQQKSSYANLLNELEEQKSTAKSLILNLQSDLLHSRSNLQQSEERNSSLQHSIVDYESEIIILKKSLTEKTEVMESERRVAEQKIEALESEIQTLKESLSLTTAAVEESPLLKENIHSLTSELEHLRETLAFERERVTSLEADLNAALMSSALPSSVSAVSADAESLIPPVEDETKLVEFSSEESSESVEVMREKIAALEETVRTLRLELEVESAQVRNWVEVARRFEIAFETTEGELVCADAMLESATKTSKVLEVQNASLEEQIQQLQSSKSSRSSIHPSDSAHVEVADIHPIEPPLGNAIINHASDMEFVIKELRNELQVKNNELEKARASIIHCEELIQLLDEAHAEVATTKFELESLSAVLLTIPLCPKTVELGITTDSSSLCLVETGFNTDFSPAVMDSSTNTDLETTEISTNTDLETTEISTNTDLETTEISTNTERQVFVDAGTDVDNVSSSVESVNVVESLSIECVDSSTNTESLSFVNISTNTEPEMSRQFVDSSTSTEIVDDAASLLEKMGSGNIKVHDQIFESETQAQEELNVLRVAFERAQSKLFEALQQNKELKNELEQLRDQNTKNDSTHLGSTEYSSAASSNNESNLTKPHVVFIPIESSSTDLGDVDDIGAEFSRKTLQSPVDQALSASNILLVEEGKEIACPRCRNLEFGADGPCSCDQNALLASTSPLDELTLVSFTPKNGFENVKHSFGIEDNAVQPYGSDRTAPSPFSNSTYVMPMSSDVVESSAKDSQKKVEALTLAVNLLSEELEKFSSDYKLKQPAIGDRVTVGDNDLLNPPTSIHEGNLSVSQLAGSSEEIFPLTASMQSRVLLLLAELKQNLQELHASKEESEKKLAILEGKSKTLSSVSAVETSNLSPIGTHQQSSSPSNRLDSLVSVIVGPDSSLSTSHVEPLYHLPAISVVEEALDRNLLKEVRVHSVPVPCEQESTSSDVLGVSQTSAEVFVTLPSALVALEMLKSSESLPPFSPSFSSDKAFVDGHHHFKSQSSGLDMNETPVSESLGSSNSSSSRSPIQHPLSVSQLTSPRRRGRHASPLGRQREASFPGLANQAGRGSEQDSNYPQQLNVSISLLEAAANRIKSLQLEVSRLKEAQSSMTASSVGSSAGASVRAEEPITHPLNSEKQERLTGGLEGERRASVSHSESQFLNPTISSRSKRVEHSKIPVQSLSPRSHNAGSSDPLVEMRTTLSASASVASGARGGRVHEQSRRWHPRNRSLDTSIDKGYELVAADETAPKHKLPKSTLHAQSIQYHQQVQATASADSSPRSARLLSGDFQFSTHPVTNIIIDSSSSGLSDAASLNDRHYRSLYGAVAGESTGSDSAVLVRNLLPSFGHPVTTYPNTVEPVGDTLTRDVFTKPYLVHLSTQKSSKDLAPTSGISNVHITPPKSGDTHSVISELRQELASASKERDHLRNLLTQLKSNPQIFQTVMSPASKSSSLT